ncbi:molybdenum cofactor biosynthesis prote [Microstroma glucosiphilum]|uniref:Molybdenum cofactor biosynthesis prote n=1 Tax=Pseudomicrostroma glucosiphilum TaxID=1684307 RepID=A0A316UFV7_9BASI|nr:molybdenum cofactor biosynthesis prote [Pseudomicrostroma glucosiphilum]PWN24142.1 molybdenum cofactor biosynthesis prote [Pseudomicrostroma glucosiphilum]
MDAARPADLEYPAERSSPPAASLDTTTASLASSSSSPTLLDSFSRKHTYLRLSLTERCSFRCVYCMPPSGVPLTPKPHLLTTPEVMRIAKAFVEMGVKKVRLTGGEPLLRKDVAEIVRKLRDDLDVREIGLTTNGLVLERMLPELVSSGLTHVNISIDSLRHDRFAELSRMPGKTLDKIMSAIRAALSIRKEQTDGGLDPSKALKIKLNVVVMKGRNDDEVADFVDLTKNMDLDVRFIEYMPFFSNSWSTSLLVPSSDLLSSLSARHSNIERHVDSANDTTRHYTIPNHRGRFGFISSMTDHFCGSCNRVRVLADGGMKVCLFGDGGKGEVSLRDAIRQSPPASADGEDADLPLKQLISLALDKKHFKHAGLRNPLEIWQAAEGRKGGEETSGDAQQHGDLVRYPRPQRRTSPIQRSWGVQLATSITALSASERLQKRSRALGLGSPNFLPGLFKAQRLRLFSSTSSASNQGVLRSDEVEEDEEEDFNPWADLDDSTTDWERAQAKSSTTRSDQASASSAREEPSTGSNQLSGGMKLSEEEKMWLAAVSAKLDRDVGRNDSRPQRQRAPAQTLEYSPTPRIVYPSPPTSEPIREEPRVRNTPPATPPLAQSSRLTHLDASTHQPSMVNISSKPSTLRTATAVGKVFLPWSCLDLLSTSTTSGGSVSDGEGIGEVDSPAGKGPVFTTARLAGVMAAKRTAEWVPLCHSVPLDGCEILFDLVIPPPVGVTTTSSSSSTSSAAASMPYISIRATTTTRSATGVEMEALVAVQAAATTVWDMLKSVAGKEMRVGDVMVVQKSGGKSGDWIREEE